MRPLYEAGIIQIEITNACTHECANCTRCVGHHKKPFFMTLDEIEKAILSLDGFPKIVGIMGGEPPLHPQFKEICGLMKKHVPIYRAGLWTSGFKWNEYYRMIKETFGLVLYNDHWSSEQQHQPILIAIDDVICDKNLMWDLISHCWVQEKWSPSITPKGAFFCEVAAALDMLFNGPGGYPVEKGWWKRGLGDFQDQVKRYCPMCSGALPMLRPSPQSKKDMVSKSNWDRLKLVGSPKTLRGDVELFDRIMDNEVINNRVSWKPWRYLKGPTKRKKDLKLNELWLIYGLQQVRLFYLKQKWMLTHKKQKEPSCGNG